MLQKYAYWSINPPGISKILSAIFELLPKEISTLLFNFKILRTNKSGLTINSIFDLLNKLLREPVYASIRYLYPKLYRIDDIQQDQSYKFRGVDSDYIIVKNLN